MFALTSTPAAVGLALRLDPSPGAFWSLTSNGRRLGRTLSRIDHTPCAQPTCTATGEWPTYVSWHEGSGDTLPRRVRLVRLRPTSVAGDSSNCAWPSATELR